MEGCSSLTDWRVANIVDFFMRWPSQSRTRLLSVLPKIWEVSLREGRHILAYNTGWTTLRDVWIVRLLSYEC